MVICLQTGTIMVMDVGVTNFFWSCPSEQTDFTRSLVLKKNTRFLAPLGMTLREEV